MKLFLYSLMLLGKHIDAIKELCGKEPHDLSVALIENAADVVTEGPDGWVEEIRNSLKLVGFKITLIDLREYFEKLQDLEKVIKNSDVIWIGGGNMFYLRWILRETKADIFIAEMIRSGKIYCGWSAGACVAGPTLLDGEKIDDITQAKKVIYEGMNLVDFVMIPHMDSAYFSESAKEWNARLKSRGVKTIPLNDNQGIKIDDQKIEII